MYYSSIHAFTDPPILLQKLLLSSPGAGEVHDFQKLNLVHLEVILYSSGNPYVSPLFLILTGIQFIRGTSNASRGYPKAVSWAFIHHCQKPFSILRTKTQDICPIVSFTPALSWCV